MKKVLFLLGHLNDRDVEWLIENGHKETLKPGDILIHRNEPIQQLYIVLSGQLAVTDGVANMKELAKVAVGEVVGEMVGRPVGSAVGNASDEIIGNYAGDVVGGVYRCWYCWRCG